MDNHLYLGTWQMDRRVMEGKGSLARLVVVWPSLE
jgi:hypothetical protein